MEEYKKDLGKVVLTPEGVWDNNKEYDILSIVYNEENEHAYISNSIVPKGIDINDKRYWMPLNVSGYSDSNMIILNKTDELGNIIPYTLQTAIHSIPEVARRKGLILSFYNDNDDRIDVNGCWEIWQFNDINLYNWENTDYWVSIYYNHNQFVGWYRDDSRLLFRYPNPKMGQYAYVGNTVAESTVYRCDVNGQWLDTGSSIPVNTINIKIVQELGTDASKIISQAAITREFNNILKRLEALENK